MKPLFATIVTAMLFSVPVSGKMTRSYESATDGTPVMIVDSIDYRKELTRVYGRLAGAPNTNSRVDMVSVTAGGKVQECTDIDGVDFNRYFQWEESGEIAIELDFSPMAPTNEGVLTIKTPQGESVTKFTLTSGVKGKKARGK